MVLLDANDPTEPHVSVCIIAYNHASFVARALSSVLEQDVAFPYEIVLADDFSPDGTLKIAQQIAHETHVPVRVLPRTENLGAAANFLDLLAAARGKYVAYLEADDNWLDRNRLATQIAMLEERPDLAGVFGRAQVVDVSDRPLGDFFAYCQCPEPEAETDERIAIARGSSAPSCTMVFRRAAIRHMPTWFDASHQGLSVVITAIGKLAFVDRVWGNYRIHAGGTWSQVSALKRATINLRYAVALASDRSLSTRFPREIGQRLTLSAVSFALEHWRAGSGSRSMLSLRSELAPALTSPALRAVALSMPRLMRFAIQRARARSRVRAG